MRIRLTLRTEKKEFPRDYRPVLVSLLKKALSEYDEDIFMQFYSKQKTVMKHFSMAVFFRHPVFNENKIELAADKVELTISSNLLKELMVLMTALLRLKKSGYKFPLPGANAMLIEKIIKLQDKEISGEMIIKFSSPLLLREHDRTANRDRYITVEDDDFKEQFYRIARAELELLGMPAALADGLQIEPLEAHKTVLPAFGHNVGASLGMFRLSGRQEALRLFYEAGISSRRSQGFGMFDIIY